MWRILLSWLVILAVAVLNGTLRDKGYGKRMDGLRAQQLSSVLLSACIVALTFLFARLGLFASHDAWLVSGMWLLLTLLFEFGFFHYVMKYPWKELLAAYDIRKGRLWLLVLATTLFAPVLVAGLFPPMTHAVSDPGWEGLSPAGNVGAPCSVDEECETPFSFLVQSRCPFSAACIENECRVICSDWLHDPEFTQDGSMPRQCAADEECDCAHFTAPDLEACRCHDGVCVAVIAHDVSGS